MQWKLCLVVTKATERYLKDAISHLQGLGFRDGCHVVAQPGVSVPNSQFVSRQRIEESEGAVIRRRVSESELWVEAIDTLSRVYTESSDVFLFATPDIRFCRALKILVEDSLEEEFIGIYLPYSPLRYYQEEEYVSLPCQTAKFGWCEVRLAAASLSCNALIMHRHTARLAAAYLSDLSEEDRRLRSWPELVYFALSHGRGIISYAAVPSFANSLEGVANDFQDVPEADMSPKREWYLN